MAAAHALEAGIAVPERDVGPNLRAAAHQDGIESHILEPAGTARSACQDAGVKGNADGDRDEVRLVVHGHFYQPPRENPWTEVVAVEPSAEPFHDWNERVAAECYRPNGWARVVDDHGRITAIVNNYRHLSFDAGPTLLSWLEAHRPEVYRRILDADRAGRGAIALAYNHAILPLCNEADLRTQVRWGLADFAHRFGRPAEGMWLPEAAVNDTVLRVLAQEGVRFTILAPHQAATAVVSGRPYRWEDPDGEGAGVDLVFYDGAISHDLAFGFSGMSSRELLDRLRAAGRDGDPVCLATDGETFGHHHKYTDRALAYAFIHAATAAKVRVLSAAQLLRELGARERVAVRESSWSCGHGVERWRSDCGCSTGGGPGWHQRWRGPLRVALDRLRDDAAAVFERRGRRVLRDPWTARDAYIEVVLGRRGIDDFLAEHGVAGTGPDGVVVALTLLEAQRHALLMYTSCGWFFNDLAGIETVQVLRYAARTLDLLDELGEAPPRHELLDRLARAQSNDPDEGDGRRVWARHVEPVRVDAGRVAAHLALVELFDQAAPTEQIAAFDVVAHRTEHRRLAGRDGLTGCAGRVTLVHRRTRRRSEHVYAALRCDGLDVSGITRAVGPADRLASDQADERRDPLGGLLGTFEEALDRGAPLDSLLSPLAQGEGWRRFGLDAALPDAADQIVQGVVDSLAERFSASLAQLYAEHRPLFGALAAAGYSLPAELRLPAQLALAGRFEAALAPAGPTTAADPSSVGPDVVAQAMEVLAEATARGLAPVTPGAAVVVGGRLLRAVQAAVAVPEPGPLRDALAMARLAAALDAALDVPVDLSPAQEAVFDALSQAGPASALVPLGRALGLAV